KRGMNDMNWIYQGTLKQNNTIYQVRRLVLDDIPALLFLQKLALEELNNSDILQPLEPSEFEYILKGNGLMIGAFADEQLIAFRALLIPPIDEEEHLGLFLGLENKLDEIMYQERSLVDTLYLVNKLHKKHYKQFIEILLKEAQSLTLISATIVPNNINSIKDKIKQNMMVGALIDIYGGKLRYVFYKKINKS